MATLKVPHQVGDLGGYLKEQRESARLSLRQLATVAGVSNPYLSQIERGMRRPSAEVLQQIAKGLQISAEALFMRAGLLEDSRGLDVEVAVQSDVQLTARQKRVLLDIYATFRAENARSDAESGTDAGPGGLKPSPPHAEGAGDGAEIPAPAPITRKRAAAKAARAATAGTANTSKQAASTAKTTATAETAGTAKTAAVAKAVKKTARAATGTRTVGSRAVKSAASRARTTPTT